MVSKRRIIQREEDTAGITLEEDVVYGRVHGAGLLADLAYPPGHGPFPAMVSVHGGRWRAGHKRDDSAINVEQWAGLGYFAVSIDYRLVECTPAPACYEDLLCALRWVHAHAQHYHIDRKRIYLIGQSAGGHLVSMAATLGDGPFAQTGGWEHESSDFRAVISIAACYDLNTLSWGELWSPPGADGTAARHQASPLHCISDKTKPILIIHADNDHSVPIQQAIDMAAALEKVQARSSFKHYQDKGHMGITDFVIRDATNFVEALADTATHGDKS